MYLNKVFQELWDRYAGSSAIIDSIYILIQFPVLHYCMVSRAMRDNTVVNCFFIRDLRTSIILLEAWEFTVSR